MICLFLLAMTSQTRDWPALHLHSFMCKIGITIVSDYVIMWIKWDNSGELLGTWYTFGKCVCYYYSFYFSFFSVFLYWIYTFLIEKISQKCWRIYWSRKCVYYLKSWCQKKSPASIMPALCRSHTQINTEYLKNYQFKGVP